MDEPEPRLDMGRVMKQLRDPEVLRHLNQICRVALDVDDLAAQLEEIDIGTSLRRDGLERTLYSFFLLTDRATHLLRTVERLGGGLGPPAT